MAEDREWRSNAIVLHARRFGEGHRSICLLTEERGVLWVIGHGASARSRRLRGNVELFVSGTARLYTNPSAGSTRLQEYQPIALHSGIREDLERHAVASLWAELTMRSFDAGGEPAPLFRLLSAGLDALDGADASAAIALSVRFLLRFLRLLGMDYPVLAQAHPGTASGDAELAAGAVWQALRQQQRNPDLPVAASLNAHRMLLLLLSRETDLQLQSADYLNDIYALVSQGSAKPGVWGPAARPEGAESGTKQSAEPGD